MSSSSTMSHSRQPVESTMLLPSTPSPIIWVDCKARSLRRHGGCKQVTSVQARRLPPSILQKAQLFFHSSLFKNLVDKLNLVGVRAQEVKAQKVNSLLWLHPGQNFQSKEREKL